jgi:type IV pilus assembly protein PilE
MRNAARSNRGFTLIELMIAVAILGVLAAIAFPAYQSQVRKGNRAAAQGAMMDIANKQQFYLSSQRQYASSLSDFPGYVLPAEVSRFYTVTLAADNAGTPPTFTITATPTGAQVDDGVLTLDSTGTKMRAGDATKW